MPVAELASASDVQPRSATERPFSAPLLVARMLLAADRVTEADRLLKPLAPRMQDNLQFMKLWAQIKHTQGRLTEAIRAFGRVRSLERGEISALLQLEVIHRLSQSAGSEKRELELIGDHALAKRHLALMELEKAFALADKHQYTSAVQLCDRLAQRYRISEREIYKLAVLQKALLLERIGNYTGGIEVLEGLGRERGFEADGDRLRCLARAYELRGRTQDLSRALRVYDFLYERTHSSELISRMGRVAARKGDEQEAQRLERAFTAAFLEEHHDLSSAELLDAAACHYIPISELRALVASKDDLSQLATALEEQAPRDRSAKRRLALLRAIQGDHASSAELWRELIANGQGCAVDTKYYGDLRATQGDRAGARALYLAALSEEDVADATILDLVLSEGDPELDRLILSIFSDASKRDRTYEALKHAAKSNQLSPGVWTTLAKFERLLGLSSEAERHEVKARALTAVIDRASPKIGHVKVAAVYQIHGHKQGIVHEIWASRYPVGRLGRAGPGGQLDESSIFGNVAPDMLRDIQNVFVAVKTFVQERFPHLVADMDDYRYILKVTKEDEPSGGNSAGIAVALAFLSVLLQRPLPDDMAVTGALVADASTEIRLARVADVDHKVIGVYQRRLARLILPSENKIDLEQSHLVPREIWQKRVAFASTLTQLMKLVFGNDLWEW